jgi:hypothetical protein
MANVAILTGIVFDVLDVDRAGWPSLVCLVELHEPLEIGSLALTSGGGSHYLFRPTGQGNRAGFVRGCDWRGTGGYIVAPPSIHPSGGRYEWAIGIDEVELCPAPSWLVDLLRKPVTAALPVSVAPRRGPACARAALRAECRKVAAATVGTRNDRLNSAAFAVATLIGAGLLDPDEAASALLAAAAQCALPETEARKTIASGFCAGFAQPRQVAS